jgi:hypothetical protein
LEKQTLTKKPDVVELDCHVALYGSWHGISKVLENISNYSVITDYQRIGDLDGCEILCFVIQTTTKESTRMHAISSDGFLGVACVEYDGKPLNVLPLQSIESEMRMQGWGHGI